MIIKLRQMEMERNIAKITYFIIKPPSASMSIGKIFITKPSTDREIKYGKLFGFLIIESVNTTTSELTKIIINEMKYNFYNDRIKNLNERIKNDASHALPSDLELRFENSLKKTNIAVSGYLEQDGSLYNINRTRVLLASIKDTNLMLSYCGNLHGLLLQFKKKDDYRVVDILESSHGYKNEINPFNLFSQTLNGKLKSSDYLFFCTDNVMDYLSFESIKTMITQNPNQEVMDVFKKTFKDRDSSDIFMGLLLNIETKASAVTTNIASLQNFNYQTAASRDSMVNLIKKEKSTEKMLSPTLVPDLKKISIQLKNLFNHYITDIKSRSKKIAGTKQDIHVGTTIPIKLKKDFLTTSKKKVSYSLKNYTSKIIHARLFHRILNFLKTIIRPVAHSVSHLNIKSKILLVLLGIALILFLSNTIGYIKKTKHNTKITKFNTILTEVIKKRDAATAAIISRNEPAARMILTDAKQLLTTISKESIDDPRVMRISSDIEKDLLQLQHRTELTDPLQLANFTNLDQNNIIAPLLVLQQNRLYSQNHKNSSLYQLDLQSRVISAIKPPSENIGKFIFGLSWQRNDILFIDKDLNFYQFETLSSELTLLNIKINKKSDIIGIAEFNRQLYLLDVLNNQITKYTLSEPQGVIGQNWLKDATVNLKNAVSIAIDGDIYILYQTGEIHKLTRGQVVAKYKNFVDPPVQSPKMIKTHQGSLYLYISDPPTRRIIVLKKDGSLHSQFTSKYFFNIIDFAVDEKDKKIYILSNASVYGIPLNF